MPINKNASYRYRLIDQCLSNQGRHWTLKSLHHYISEKLIEEFDARANEKGMAISERQLLDDIALMRKDPPQGYAAPIVRRKGQIYYDDASFSISESPLNKQDLEAIQEALMLLKQFSVFPHYRELNQVVHKFKMRVNQFEGRTGGDNIIQFEQNETLKGINLLEPIYNCIRGQKPIMLVYQPFQLEIPIRTVFHPYLLKEYNNRWFLFGWDQGEKAIRNYPLDRIESFEPTAGNWYQSPDFDPEKYFKNIYGVSLMEEEQLEEILLKATVEQAKYIKTKPIHPSQEIISNNESGVVFSLRLIPNYELESLILSFGDKVKVLAPERLARKLADRLERAGRQYGNDRR